MPPQGPRDGASASPGVRGVPPRQGERLCDLVEVEQVNPARCLSGLFNPRKAYGSRPSLMSSSAPTTSAGSMLQGGKAETIKNCFIFAESSKIWYRDKKKCLRCCFRLLTEREQPLQGEVTQVHEHLHPYLLRCDLASNTAPLCFGSLG